MLTNTKNLNQAFDILLKEARFYPRTKILSELNLITDRIRFSANLQELFSTKNTNKEKLKATITTLFEDDLSEEIHGFLLNLADNDLSNLLVKENAQEFIEFCQNKLYQIKELFFVTAIPLSNNFREIVIANIKTVFINEEIRVIFEVKPNTVVGFLLQDGKVLYDYTFKTNFVYYLNSYFKTKLEAIR